MIISPFTSPACLFLAYLKKVFVHRMEQTNEVISLYFDHLYKDDLDCFTFFGFPVTSVLKDPERSLNIIFSYTYEPCRTGIVLSVIFTKMLAVFSRIIL